MYEREKFPRKTIMGEKNFFVRQAWKRKISLQNKYEREKFLCKTIMREKNY